jgi:uncharacterized protein (DUF697 family)
MELLKALLKSKKVQASFVGVTLVSVDKIFGLDLDPLVVAEIVTIIVAYIIGQGVADAGKHMKK